MILPSLTATRPTALTSGAAGGGGGGGGGAGGGAGQEQDGEEPAHGFQDIASGAMQVGSRCSGEFGAGTVRRVNEDGTFTVEPDVKEMIVMPYWYGVTLGELTGAVEEPNYFRLYWNQTRMGGRQPGEVGRRVTMDDALVALGLADAAVDEGVRAAIGEFERQEGVKLPTELVRLLVAGGVGERVLRTHPNNPELVEVKYWELVKVGAQRVLPIVEPHQGNHKWSVMFDDGMADAQVFVAVGEQYLLTAPSCAMFFWDLAQTGLAWYQETGFKGGKPVVRTDLGLALVPG